MMDPTDPRVDDDAGLSLEERAEAGEHEKEDFPQGFLDGMRPPHATQIEPGDEVALKVVMTNAEVPLRTGLLDVNRTYRLAVTVKPTRKTEDPVSERLPDGTWHINSWKVIQKVRPVFLEELGDYEAATRRNFEQLLVTNPKRAGVVADELLAQMTKSLRNGDGSE